MLDRKTKDRDASIELLEDRTNQLKQFTNLIIGIAIIMIILGMILGLCFGYILTGICIGMLSIVVLVLGLFITMARDHYSILIYLKQKLEK